MTVRAVALSRSLAKPRLAMGKKDKLGLHPADQHRKDQKKKDYKKILKQRHERKEAKINMDPAMLEVELHRLRDLNEQREAGGGTAKMKRKIEEMEEIHRQSLMRQAEKEEEEASL